MPGGLLTKAWFSSRALKQWQDQDLLGVSLWCGVSGWEEVECEQGHFLLQHNCPFVHYVHWLSLLFHLQSHHSLLNGQVPCIKVKSSFYQLTRLIYPTPFLATVILFFCCRKSLHSPSILHPHWQPSCPLPTRLQNISFCLFPLDPPDSQVLNYG